MLLVTAKQMQNMDGYTINGLGIPGRVLMENAGRGAVDMFVRKFSPDQGTRVGMVAGRGNNGGDGFVMARYLMEMGVPVTMFLLSRKEKVAGDAAANLTLAQQLLEHHPDSKLIEIPDADALKKNRAALVHQDLFIDAIFGTGLNDQVRGFFKEVIQLLNQTGRPVFAVDIASGLNADTGKPLGEAVRASATATFAHAKAGHILYPGNEYTGDLEVIDIGIPGFVTRKEGIGLHRVETADIAPLFPQRPFNSHKGNFGHALILAGSPGKTGAAALCANAAVRTGAGLVTLGLPAGINPSVEAMVIEPMTLPLPETVNGTLSPTGFDAVMSQIDSFQALAIGPGIGTDEQTRDLVTRLIEYVDIPMVIDADGLNCLSQTPDILTARHAPTILTPHPGEMARLCDTTPDKIQADRMGSAAGFAAKYGVILVLKGAQTLTAMPDGNLFINPTGNPGMASGGMGDVLTGIITGLMAQGLPAEHAAMAGVFLHGLGADILACSSPGFGFTASDLIRIIPEAIQETLE